MQLTSTTSALFSKKNYPIIPELCFMLLWTDYSGNYAGIIDSSLVILLYSRCITDLSTSVTESRNLYCYSRYMSTIHYELHFSLCTGGICRLSVPAQYSGDSL